jgi:hypothetical protein
MAAPTVNPGPDPKKRGYRRLAEFMAWDPAVAIFPRFRRANHLNLLLLQAEISELEDEIDLRSEIEDRLDDAQKSCDLAALRDEGENDTRWKRCLELRAKLAEYSTSYRGSIRDRLLPYDPCYWHSADNNTDQALAHQIVLNDQLEPTDLNLTQLQYWYQHPNGGDSELRGPGSLNWMPEPFGKPSSDQLALASKLSDEKTLSLRLADLIFPAVKKLPPRWTKVRNANRRFVFSLSLLLTTCK